MSVAVYPIDPKTFLVPTDTAKAAGSEFSERYQAATPYNYISIDNFLPEEILGNVLQDLTQLPKSEESYTRAQENLKSSYVPERLPTYTKNLFYALNARPFLQFLEEMTGIDGLIPDPYFIGAGVHKTLNGGHLDIHADFNLHKQLGIERRLNVLIYLNKGWREEYGGSFEVWNKEMTKKEASILPVFNRMACFSTGSDTFHGNPEPVNHPDGEARQSIALYYYTATWDATRKAHNTLFKPRPGTKDEKDRLVARQQFVENVLPPFIYRRVAGKLRRIGF